MLGVAEAEGFTELLTVVNAHPGSCRFQEGGTTGLQQINTP